MEKGRWGDGGFRAPTTILLTVEGSGLNKGKRGNLDMGRFQSIGCENYKFSKC